MKCSDCIHCRVCSAYRSDAYDACDQIIPAKHIEELEHKLEWLLSYITDGKYSKSSYSIEEMQTFVDDEIYRAVDNETAQAEAVIESYKNDILNLREENTALKDTIVKMAMERMNAK